MLRRDQMMTNKQDFKQILTLFKSTMIKRISLFILLACCLTTAGLGQQSYDEIEFPPLDEFNKPEVVRFTTHNGIRFFLIEDHELPLIDVNVRIRTGGIQIPDSLTGLASITGSVMRSGGTESIPSDSLNQLLANNAARISTGIGFTSGFAGLNVLKEDFDELLPVFVDVLMNPAFPEEKIALAKKQAKSAISRRNDNVSQVASREFNQLIFGENTIYGRTTEYATINNIDRKEVTAFHEENFVGENMMVGVVGDFQTEEMKQKLKEAFGQIPAGEENNLQFPEVNYNYASTINFINKPAVTQATVYLGHIGGTRPNPDYAEIQVMNNVLSGGFSGRLFQIVRTDMGLAYSVGGQYDLDKFYPGKFYVMVKTKNATVSEAIDAIIHELERLQNKPISEEELELTKDQFFNSLVFRNTSYEQILGRIMSNAYRHKPENAFNEFVEGIRTTTIPEVQNMAQQYIHPDELQILVVGKKEVVLPQLQKYGNVNIIDISIPKPDVNQEPKEVKGDTQQGAKLLGQMADAIVAPSTEVNKLTLKGEVKMMGRTLPTTMIFNFPNSLKQTIQTARGNIVISYKNGTATMSRAGQKRTLPASSPLVSNLKAALNRSIVAIAMKADELNPKYLGEATFENETYAKLSVNVSGKTLTILLDQETYLPRLMRFQKFSPRLGKSITVETRFSEWTTNEGVTFPYTQASYGNGKKAATATFSSHSVN